MAAESTQTKQTAAVVSQSNGSHVRSLEAADLTDVKSTFATNSPVGAVRKPMTHEFHNL